MIRLIIILGLTFSTLGPNARSDELYQVNISSKSEATTLARLPVDPVLRTSRGFIVLTSKENANLLQSSSLDITLLRGDIERAQLVIDKRRDESNARRFEILFQEGVLRLLSVDDPAMYRVQGESDLLSIDSFRPRISYVPLRKSRSLDQATILPLDSLIDQIELDSLQSYTEQLQAFYRRTAGTESNYESRDWIAAKLTAFGYDSTVVDSFQASLSGTLAECQNVLAYKIGTQFPEHQIVIGAHRDAVAASPGADDNGSGTAGVLELARLFKSIDTDVTLVFALFDAEEYGLYGSWHYVNEITTRGDSLLYMLNMDMIGYYQNTSNAALYYGSDNSYAQLWRTLADSLLSLNGVLSGASAGSDHFPFSQYGYPVTFVAEYIFSGVYHSARDSTSYMDFSYMTKLVQISLATAYVASQTFTPSPSLSITISGTPSEMLNPGVPNSIKAEVTEIAGGTISDGSVLLNYVTGSDSTALIMTEIGPGLFEGFLPSSTCQTRFQYFISADELSGETFYCHDPAHPHHAIIATSTSVEFYDDFQLDKGWAVSGTATDGQWNRGVPLGGGLRGDPAADFDGSGNCYLTDNEVGNSDVDGGTTVLTSPVFALSDAPIRIDFARWYSNNFGAAPNADISSVKISNDAGNSWTTVDSAGPVHEASGGWFHNSFWVNGYVSPTATVQLQFEAADLGDGSVIEAAIDAIRVSSYQCDTGCCVGYTGNIDGDSFGNCDIADLTFLIDHLFINFPALICHDEGNVDGDGAGLVDIADLTFLIDHLFINFQPTAVCQ